MGFSGVYIVVSGAPASGKSTLAAPLAAELGLPLLAKDTIKEALLDELGVGDLDWSRRAGRAAIAVLYSVATTAGAAVLENFWHPELAPPSLRSLGAPLIEVFCDCPPDVARARFEQRLATRHPGHHDGDREYLASWPGAQPLGLGPVVVVDTSGPVDVKAVAARVRAQPGWPSPHGLHNVTLYTEPGEQFEAVRAFYAAVPGLSPVYEQSGHICCFDAGGEPAVCVHEAEPGRPAGTRELFFWIDAETDDEVHLTDPLGNRVRLHRRRTEP